MSYHVSCSEGYVIFNTNEYKPENDDIDAETKPEVDTKDRKPEVTAGAKDFAAR